MVGILTAESGNVSNIMMNLLREDSLEANILVFFTMAMAIIHAILCHLVSFWYL